MPHATRAFGSAIVPTKWPMCVWLGRRHPPATSAGALQLRSAVVRASSGPSPRRARSKIKKTETKIGVPMPMPMPGRLTELGRLNLQRSA